MTTEAIVGHFAAARRNGSGWMAKCPAHDDTKASLSIAPGTKGTLLTCHAGCTLDAIAAAAGLAKRDLFFDDGPKATAPRIVATYDYEDLNHEVLYQAVRMEPKDFRQRRPNSKGGFTWNMKGVSYVLFQLPEWQGQETVYIAEGEKDALKLRQIGLSATTNIGGAGKWRAEYTAQLVAANVKHVVILPDNDDPGRQHAQQVASCCHAAGLRVHIVHLSGLPAKGDVSDFLAQRQKADLLTEVAAAPAFEGGGRARERSAERPARSVHLTPASTIQVRAVRWFWLNRLALGTLALIGGREGIGKSICAYTLAAMTTRGHLPGACFGTPRAVIVVATEDSWEHTIVPRLMAAGADLTRIYRADVQTADLGETMMSLPRDVAELELAIAEVSAALILLDPLLSRLDSDLDTHKDAEVRRALEPLGALADRTRTLILGFIHVNKSTSTDALTTLMGSRAFAAVARAVLFVMTDPNDEHSRLLGQAKNNLGRMDLPTLGFRIVETHVADTPEGPVHTGKLEWTGESDLSIRDALDASSLPSGDKTATSEAMGWLEDFLRSEGGQADSSAVKRKGAAAGHSTSALHRARQKLKVNTVTSGFPRRTFWCLSSHPQGRHITKMNETTGTNDGQSSQSFQLSETPREEGTTDGDRL